MESDKREEHRVFDKFKELYAHNIIGISWDNDGKIKIVKEDVLSCSTKVKFATEKDAIFSLDKITKTSKRKVIPIRAYRCECGSWHLTSKADKFSEQVTPFKERIEELEVENKLLKDSLKKLEIKKNDDSKMEITSLKEVVESLKRKNNKDENIKVKSDSRVIELKKGNKSLNETNLRLRKEVSDLISSRNDKNKVNELETLSVNELFEFQKFINDGFKNTQNTNLDVTNWFNFYQKVFFYVRANKDPIIHLLGIKNEKITEPELVKELVRFQFLQKPL